MPEYGKRFFEDMYADRTHFIYELLQNAEDAIGRRTSCWDGPRSVSFQLSTDHLRVVHSGDPFNEKDVRSICSIDDSTKKESLTEIGRFGVGFKSVYAFTNCPEVHSGTEDFAIDSYVWPRAIDPLRDRRPDETVFILPFRSDVPSAYTEIDDGLRNIGIQTLLFLRQIEEVRWENDEGGSGHYLRETEQVDEGVLRTTVIAQVEGEENVHEQRWLTFHREIASTDEYPAARIEIAFLTDSETDDFLPVEDPTLFAYFPTERPMHCGFLANGPYRTTLNRENVPDHDSWNQRLMAETASLLVQSLRWLRDSDRLDADVIRCLPLRSWATLLNYRGRDLLQPLYEHTRKALTSEPLLPRLGGGYVAANRADMGRTAALRALLTSDHLADIYGSNVDMSWLAPSISQDYRLSEYVTDHLKVVEVRPETIVTRLTRMFLEKQCDDWIQELYEFLHDQRALVQRVGSMPVIRLENGNHVEPKMHGQVQAYLPAKNDTGFPTVARSVCDSYLSRQFLRSLGLSEPDAVDDVLLNLIPKYTSKPAEIDDCEYADDVRRILNAFEMSVGDQRLKLIRALRATSFVRLIDIGESSNKMWGSPSRAYLPSEELSDLFHGIQGVLFVDRTYKCLCGDRVEELLKACGSASVLRAEEFKSESRFTQGELIKMRIRRQGHNGSTRVESVNDWRISGLQQLLNSLSTLDQEVRSRKAKLLWRSLAEVNSYDFSGRYRWFYRTSQYQLFNSEFVEVLNKTAWVPAPEGSLEKPSAVVFEDLDWDENAFLQSKIPFKPSTIRVLAQEAGFQPELLDLLKSKGVTTASEFLEAIGESADDDQASEVTIAVTTIASTPDSTPSPGTPVGSSTIPVDTDQGSSVPGQNGNDTTSPNNGGPTGGGPGQSTSNPGSSEVSFAARLYAVQTIRPSDAGSNPFVPPTGGPSTPQSARTYTRNSVLLSQTEANVLRTATTSELGPNGRELAEEFRDMVHGDYGKRCQICSRTFERTGGGWLVNVVHVVPLRDDRRGNNFGDLLGLCGWHFNLLQHGEWALLDPETDLPFEDSDGSHAWEQMRTFILDRPVYTDQFGYPFVGLPVRFSNVYHDWQADPDQIEEQIRYSIPHWEFLRALLNV
ncbi:MAG: hypothetical protein F4Z35_03435 [Dehalococcoidia bacterium]|nr:hypothetical protein [Dehalococcoidia bacterium]